MDYEKLLDDFVSGLYEYMDALDVLIEGKEVGSAAWHRLQGVKDGVARSLATLSFLEKRKASKYKLQEESPSE